MNPAVPRDLKKTEVLVLIWTDHFFGRDYLESRSVPNPHGDDLRLELTQDRQRLGEADAVWFHAPSIDEVPRSKNQPWVLMSMESDVNFPALANPIVQKVFDLKMTYRLDSDVPCIYPNWQHYGSFRQQPSARSGPSEGAPVLFVASNPVPHRDDYVAELMKGVSVDSLGSCLNNGRLDGFVTGPDAWARGGRDALLELLPRYKFYLAFENSRSVDYVTEKVFHALVAGVVPVYRGAPNVRELMPADDALIVVDEHGSPSELAARLVALDHDDEAYRRHLRWKHEALPPRFRRIVDLGSVEPMLRLAVKLAHGCGHECRCGGRLRDRGVV